MKRTVLLLVLAIGISVSYIAGAEQVSENKDIKALERQLKKEPNNTTLLVTLGKAYLDAKDYGTARHLLSQAAAIDSMNASVFAMLAATYITEAEAGYSEKIHDDQEYQTRLIFHIFNNINRAIALDEGNAEYRFTRAAYILNMPVFSGFYERMDGTRDVAATITHEMVANDYEGFVGQAVGDLKMIVQSEAPDEMKAEAYYYLGKAYRILGLQYWQTLTKEYRWTEASKRAWAEMAPTIVGHEAEEVKGERVMIRFNISFESDLAPQTAVWIEDAGGNFLKTLYVSGFSGRVKEKQVVLPAWAAMSKFRGDNTTGASISYGLHQFVWDCTNDAGTRVPDATYTVKVEVHHWPSMHYQTVSADIKIGGEAGVEVVKEGNLVPFLEVRYVPE
jgi:tetratricopeptide (TPR) repeat protein